MLIRLTFLVPGLLLIIGMLMILHWKCRTIPIYGQMVTGRISLLLVGLKLRPLVFICLLLSLRLRVLSGGIAEEHGDARLERCRAFMPVPGVVQTVQHAEFWGAVVPKEWR